MKTQKDYDVHLSRIWARFDLFRAQVLVSTYTFIRIHLLYGPWLCKKFLLPSALIRRHQLCQKNNHSLLGYTWRLINYCTESDNYCHALWSSRSSSSSCVCRGRSGHIKIPFSMWTFWEILHAFVSKYPSDPRLFQASSIRLGGSGTYSVVKQGK